ncbi:MAG: hypothetical protein VKJ64_04630 [Leptolyngbyaceae bacterium]|nr:hypothetical protein [Leptolyngbyaceae bacterium]
MIHGLMWFPLLAIFIGLAWAGWNEYQKVEVYRQWATGAERAKYDIRAALKQEKGVLIWGTPSRSGILELQTLAMDEVKATTVKVDDHPIDLDRPPNRSSSIVLELDVSGSDTRRIPFTDVTLAIQWAIALQPTSV